MKTFKHGNRVFENVKSDEILIFYTGATIWANATK